MCPLAGLETLETLMRNGSLKAAISRWGWGKPCAKRSIIYDCMKSNKTVPLLEKSYQVNLKIYNYIGKFPRAQKPVLGNQILNTANRLFENVMDASYLKDEAKDIALAEIDLILKKLLLYLRFAKDLAYLSFNGYEFLAKEITEMGRMIGGWQKWQSGEKTQKSRGSVVYTMESPLIKQYLELKMAYPQQLIALKVGVFYKLFFEDAHYFRKEYNFMLRNLAAPSSPVKIESCGFPASNVEKYKREVENLRLCEYNKP